MVPLFFRSASFRPDLGVGNENVSQMYSSPISIVEMRCIIFLLWWFKDYEQTIFNNLKFLSVCVL